MARRLTVLARAGAVATAMLVLAPVAPLAPARPAAATGSATGDTGTAEPSLDSATILYPVTATPAPVATAAEPRGSAAHGSGGRTNGSGGREPGSRPRPPSHPERHPGPPPGHVVRDFPSTGRTLTLTFDDGPDPRWTPTVLRLLRQYHATAIFCVVGEHGADHPELLRQIVRDGHLLCDHSWSHDLRLARRDASTMEAEVGRTAALLTAAGAAPRYFRAPGGNWSPRLIAVARQHGMAPLGWSVDPADWSRPGAAVIVQRVLTQTHPGAIVLLHDGYGHREQSVEALRVLLERLAAAGYRFTVPQP